MIYRKRGKHYEDNKTKQTSLSCDIGIERRSEVEEACKLIRDRNVRRITCRLLLLADKRFGRKFSKPETLRLIELYSGTHNRRVLEDIFKSMIRYKIFHGVELGKSVIVKQPEEIKNFLSMEGEKTGEKGE